MSLLRCSFVQSVFLWCLSISAIADEGMWLFEDLPVDYLKSKYGFAPTEEWAEHVRLSSVRFNSGGSASFVSSQGLVLTNHHVAADTLHKLSSPKNNYAEDGFLAKNRDDEIKAPDLELNQLVSIEDVTDDVNQAVTPGMSPSEASKARQAAMAQIEKASLDKTLLRSDVITLYGGAKYHLYRFKKYTDVRLVWAPEAKAAFFGGDADNFEYPRYCLDVTLFRVYEDGKPAEIDHFLKYSANGAADGELVFVSGNPGRTQRIFTVDALKYLRDHRMPYILDLLRRREILLQQFGFEGKEQERRARDELFGIQNARKAYTGMLQGLQNPEFLDQKSAQETKLLATLNADAKLRSSATTWDTIRDVQNRQAELLGQSASFSRMSRLYSIAESLVLMEAEDKKPSEDRLREFRDSARESFEQQLYSPAPIYEDLEQVKLADSIAMFVEKRGGDDLLVQLVLQGKSPRDRAAELVGGTKLGDVPIRKAMAADGINDADPMIQLARTLNSEYRRLREIDEELTEIERQAYAKINEATVAIQGTSTYPDATFSLRLAFGTVKGYVEDGNQIEPWTDMAGAFSHQEFHESKGDWVLPDSWHNSHDKIKLDTPLNFVCTADIIGGNSGSPVVNKDAELVGVIFDGNIQSLTSDFFYSDKVGRAVCVHSGGVREALRNIYDAKHLADELGR
ncbi:MAG: S46 family peptidase [Planctomycetales bacterium]|nr:S46 family peptidase [Planctomycetales bacterium]